MKKLSVLLCVLAACGEPGDNGGNEQEVITTVQLSFMPTTGVPVVFEFDDPDGDGGMQGTAQPIALPTATSYTMNVAFINRQGTVPEDITAEVRDEGDEHQVFFTGNAVMGPATMNADAALTHSYADMDANGFPIGLSSTIMTSATPSAGVLTVTLRHMPPEAPPEKSADTAAQVASGGFATIGGTTDVMVEFPVSVQ
jgi:hypothetical protein